MLFPSLSLISLEIYASALDWIFTSELLAWLFYWGKNQNAPECRSHRIGISIESLFLNQAIFGDIMLEKVKVRILPDHEYFIDLICKRSPTEPAVLVTLKSRIAFVYLCGFTRTIVKNQQNKLQFKWPVDWWKTEHHIKVVISQVHQDW